MYLPEAGDQYILSSKYNRYKRVVVVHGMAELPCFILLSISKLLVKLAPIPADYSVALLALQRH